jgi:predicted metal-dependent hydrolase
LDVGDWLRSRAFLYGIDLFNFGYYWEAHEEWEGLWHAAGRKGRIADFLKALIKLAAAGVKHREGIAHGVKSHAGRAAELLRGVEAPLESGEDLFLGFRIAHLIAMAEAIARDGWPGAAPLLCPVLPEEA